jgi:nitrate reductase gamma subunit
MIQRVQTVYLLVAALLLGFFLGFVDLWLVVAGEAFGWLGAVLYGLGGLTAVVALVAVFLYKRRATQAKVVLAAQWFDLLLVLVLAVVLGALSFRTDADLTAAGAVGFAVLLMPVFAYVALRLARMGVRKDIDLVRSMDRLR